MPRFSDEEEDEQSDVADAWDASSEDEAPAPKPVESISTKPKLKQILKKDKTSIPAPKKVINHAVFQTNSRLRTLMQMKRNESD